MFLLCLYCLAVDFLKTVYLFLHSAPMNYPIVISSYSHLIVYLVVLE